MPGPAQRRRLSGPRQLKSGAQGHKKYQVPKKGVVATIAAMSTATHPALAPLVELVRSASAQRTPLRVRGGDTKAFHGSPAHGLPVLDTRDLSGVVAYEPTELVITALAGTPLAEIEALLAERPGRTGFNAVLTREHHDLRALKAWFAEKVGPDIFVGLEGVVNVYDAATAIGTGRFEPTELNSLTRSIFEALVEDPNAFGLGERINEFYASIQSRRSIEALGQKCGMDSPDTIAVDLRGNVMTCQNTGAKGLHKIGHVADFDAIALDTATHFAFREECMSCPVVQLCKGSCMFLEGEFFTQSCATEFAFNMGIMMAAVWHLIGMVVVEGYAG